MVLSLVTNDLSMPQVAEFRAFNYMTVYHCATEKVDSSGELGWCMLTSRLRMCTPAFYMGLVESSHVLEQRCDRVRSQDTWDGPGKV